MHSAIELRDPLTDPTWDELVGRQNQATVFHLRGWARAVCETYGYQPKYLCWMEAGDLAGCLPLMHISSWLTGRRGVSMPFSDLGGGFAGNAHQLSELFESAKALGHSLGWKRIEIRDTGTCLLDAPPSATFYRHVVDLTPDLDTLRTRFNKNTRRKVKQSEGQPYDIRVSTSEESMEAFYALLCLTRRRHGLPPQPRAFFSNLHRSLVAAGDAHVVLASLRGTPVAGAFILHRTPWAYYKYAASDPRANENSAGHAVVWQTLNWHKERGFKHLCLGRTDLGHEGLRRFKGGWGSEETELRYTTFDLQKNKCVESTHAVEGLHNALFRRCPLPLLRAAGSLLYPHMG